ncbi:MAG TPA: isocitrate/isopropylmalate family dehydrogenase, partial [Candidatus Angelobacter sp.]
MGHKVTLIPGDGIGPEVTNATVRIVDASGVKIEWERFAAGSEAFAKYGEYIPKELTQSNNSFYFRAGSLFCAGFGLDRLGLVVFAVE